jgi:hypothetical protein
MSTGGLFEKPFHGWFCFWESPMLPSYWWAKGTSASTIAGLYDSMPIDGLKQPIAKVLL